MFGSGSSHTFMTNLEKMIELIISEEAPKALPVVDIVNLLSNRYSLDFTDVEVEKTLVPRTLTRSIIEGINKIIENDVLKRTNGADLNNFDPR